jgi:hypothetical protein
VFHRTFDAIGKKLPDVEKALEKTKKDYADTLALESKMADEVTNAYDLSNVLQQF